MRTALVYGFNYVLARGNILSHRFIPIHGINDDNFWGRVAVECDRADTEWALEVLWKVLFLQRRLPRPVTRETFHFFGEDPPLFDGVSAWFDYIDTVSHELGLSLEHYLVSTGIQEIIEGASISERFHEIFASTYRYDDGHAVWPNRAIDHRSKRKFLRRIATGYYERGVPGPYRQSPLYRRKGIPFDRIIYFANAEMDGPSIEFLNQMGGNSIAVYNPKRAALSTVESKLVQQIGEKDVPKIVPASYEHGSELSHATVAILENIADSCFRSS